MLSYLFLSQQQKNVFVPTGGVLLSHVSLLHAVHTVLPWRHSTRRYRWDPVLHHARLQQTEGVGGTLFICGSVGPKPVLVGKCLHVFY